MTFPHLNSNVVVASLLLSVMLSLTYGNTTATSREYLIEGKIWRE